MDYFRQLKKLPPKFDVVVPFLKFEKELQTELTLISANVITSTDKFFAVDSLSTKPIWSQEILKNCIAHKFSKKNELINLLKNQPNLGCYFPNDICEPLAESVLTDLRSLQIKRIKFEVPSKFNFKYFIWTLLDNETVLICNEPSAQFPIGWHEFNEDKTTPPNRAYLKLWEMLTLNHISLKKDDVAIEVGSSPGGWSWVLSEQISKVYSIDKAPLDPKIAKIPNIKYTSADAFTLDPRQFADATWLFSDIICTPVRLYELVQLWMDQSKIKNFACTIKFKGDCDYQILDQFLKIPNSKIIHLYQNKNEVTWIKQE